MGNKPIVFCLMGPTASGKTAAAIEITQRLSCEIISVDSVMVYRGLDIGTAKPSKQLQAIAPHRLIDIRDPEEIYSAGEFREDALKEIGAVLSRGKIPLLVGGTMLYYYVLQNGLANLPSANAAIREEIMQQASRVGWHELHAKLKAIDPVAAARIHPNDPQRLQRALEIYLVSGQSLTHLLMGQKKESVYQFINLVFTPADRHVLKQRIEQRFKEMLKQGIISEVEKLMTCGKVDENLPAMRAVGYRQIWEYLLKKIDYTTLEEKGIIATRQLAKRQLTWLRSFANTQWFDSLQVDSLNNILRLILQTIER